MTLLLLALACNQPRWTEAGAVAPTLAVMDRDGDHAVRQAEYDGLRFKAPTFDEVDVDHDGVLSDEELLAHVLATDPANLTAPRPSAVKKKAKKVVKAGANPKGAETKGTGTNGPDASPGAKVGAAPDAAPRGAPGPGNAPPGADPKGAGSPPPSRPRPDAGEADEQRDHAEQQWVVRMVLESLREEVRSVNPDQPVPSDEAVKAAAATEDLRTAETRAVLAELEVASDAVGVGFPASLRSAVLAKLPVTPTPEIRELPPPGPETGFRQRPPGK